MSKSSSFVSAPAWPGRSGCAETQSLHVTPNRLLSGGRIPRVSHPPWEVRDSVSPGHSLENGGLSGPCVPQWSCCFLLPPLQGALAADSAPSREAHLRPPPPLLPHCWEPILAVGREELLLARPHLCCCLLGQCSSVRAPRSGPGARRKPQPLSAPEEDSVITGLRWSGRDMPRSCLPPTRDVPTGM